MTRYRIKLRTGETLDVDAESVEEIDDNVYVQVVFTNELDYRYGPKYTYIDTYDELLIGDVVLVPTRHGDRIAVVAELGKGSYTGEISRIIGRYILDDGSRW